MSEMHIQKYRDTLQRSVEALDSKSPDEREAGYARIRQALDVLLQKSQASMGPEVASLLRDALDEMIQARRGGTTPEASNEVAPKEGQPASTSAAGVSFKLAVAGRHAFWRGALVGLAVAVTFGAALAWTGGVPAFGKASDGSGAIAAAYRANLPRVQAAEAFLERVREEVVGQQQKEPDELARLAGAKFVPLKTIAPELASQLPKALRKGSKVIVRADAKGYKILFNWPLCSTVRFARPQLLDPVRKSSALGCTHFGLWNEPGAEW